MKDVRRYYISGACYFFTVVTYQRRPLFCSPIEINRLREAFKYTMQKYPFHVQGIVILPDHLHCLWRLPHGDANFSIRWRTIKHRFSISTAAKANYRREKEVWQRRFWDHVIRDESDWQRHLDYIHYNPVKHGYVNKALDWPYSSFRRYVSKELYQPDWGSILPDSIKDVDYE